MRKSLASIRKATDMFSSERLLSERFRPRVSFHRSMSSAASSGGCKTLLDSSKIKKFRKVLGNFLLYR